MTQKLFVVFSHSLTEDQVRDAKKSLSVDQVVTLKDVRPELQAEASSVDPRIDAKSIQMMADLIVLQAEILKCTHFYIAGEPTLVMLASLLAHKRGMKVVQSTTERVSQEVIQDDGSVIKTAVFKHVQWRDVSQVL